MKKHLYRHSHRLQEQLLGAALLYKANEWPLHVPRAQLDAWATLWRWNQAGEPVVRLTDEAEDALLTTPLPATLPLLSTPLAQEALAIQMPQRGVWIVIARHQPAPVMVPVHGEHSYGFAQPLLTYCGSSAAGTEQGLITGHINLLDQPTLADIHLLPGTLTDITTERPVRPLSDSDLAQDDYRLTLAIHTLYTRRP